MYLKKYNPLATGNILVLLILLKLKLFLDTVSTGAPSSVYEPLLYPGIYVLKKVQPASYLNDLAHTRPRGWIQYLVVPFTCVTVSTECAEGVLPGDVVFTMVCAELLVFIVILVLDIVMRMR